MPAADQQNGAAKPRRRQASDHIDPVGVAERQVENDDVGYGLRQSHFEGGRMTERTRREADAANDVGNELADLWLIVQDVGEATGACRYGSGPCMDHWPIMRIYGCARPQVAPALRWSANIVFLHANYCQLLAGRG